MAQRRMFSKNITNSSKFLKMPVSSRLLYYDLGMNADDDGFVEHYMVLKMTGATQQDLGVLEINGLVKIFDENVLWIRDWKENNYIQKDRYHESKYLQIYNLDTICIQDVYPGKVRLELDKSNIKEEIYKEEKPSGQIGGQKSTNTRPEDKKHKYGEYKNVLLKDTELEKLKKDFTNYQELIKYLDEYIEMKGYKAKSHYLAIKKWVVDAVEERKHKKGIEPEWMDKEIKEVGLTDEQQAIMDRIREAHRKQETDKN